MNELQNEENTMYDYIDEYMDVFERDFEYINDNYGYIIQNFENMLQTGQQIDTFTEEKLKYIKERNWEYMICAVCATNGFLHALKWLIAQEPPCPLDEKIFELATSNGHTNILQWLISQDPPCPWNEDICYKLAIQQGHLNVLKWLKAQNPHFPWSTSVCKDAVENGLNGHLHILKWLRAQNPPCPWSTSVCQAAAKNSHLRILKWLRAQEPPCPWDIEQCLNEAENTGNLEIEEWIRRQIIIVNLIKE